MAGKVKIIDPSPDRFDLHRRTETFEDIIRNANKNSSTSAFVKETESASMLA